MGGPTDLTESGDSFLTNAFIDNDPVAANGRCAVVIARSGLLGSGIAARSAGASRDGAVLGASIAGRLAPAVEIAASYDAELRDRAFSNRFALTVSGRW